MPGKTKIALEKEDHQRDAQFKEAMHGKTAQAKGGFTAILGGKNSDAQKVAVDEYFKHFDNKRAEDETEADRKVDSLATMRWLPR